MVLGKQISSKQVVIGSTGSEKDMRLLIEA